MKLLLRVIRKSKKELQKINKKIIIVLCIISCAISGAHTAYSALSLTHMQSMTITLNYEGAKKGLNPDGSRFNIGDIKSEEVLKKAIDNLGDDKLSVATIKKRIYIDSKMPQSTLTQTTQAIASGSTYSYNPSEFEIYYSQKNKFGTNNTANFLCALSEAYNEYFINAYSGKNTVLQFDKEEDISQYDYQEKYQILYDKVGSMINYLGERGDENATFRSQNTGYSFKNLVTMLTNLRDIDLAKLNAHIIQNKISIDRMDFIRKQQFLIEKDVMKFKSNSQASEITNNALDVYDPQITGVAFIPSVDEDNQYYMSRTKTGLDNLVNKSYTDGITATKFGKKIDKQNDIIKKYSDAADTDEKTMINTDAMIREISEFLSRIATLSVQTDDDYISYKTKDYITYRLPDNITGIPIMSFLKKFVVVFILLLIAVKSYDLLLPWICKKRDYFKNKLNLNNEE